MRNASISGQLAQWVTGLRWEALPGPVREMARLCLIDWAGVALMGTITVPGRLARRLAEELGGGDESTLLGSPARTSCLLAALANGVAAHAIELDDLHRPAVLHPGVTVIPAALAVAEKTGADGRDLLTAIVAGYEVVSRAGEAAGPAHYTFWHATGTCGAYGAAAAAGRLLGLDAERMAHALGSAGTMAAGLWEFLADGAMSKTLHAGKAAANGVLAALLARDGFTGASRIFEGGQGFLKAMARGGDAERLTRGLGEGYKILETSFKIHAACGHTHPAIDAALALRPVRDARSTDIAAVRVSTYKVAIDVTGNAEPATPYQAKFSLPFCVALALARGRAGLDDFTDATVRDPEVRAVMRRVTVSEDPEMSQVYPQRWPATVEVAWQGGRRTSAHVDFPAGTPENPAALEALLAKFRSLAGITLPEDRREALLSALQRTDEVTDVRFFPWM